MKLHYCYYYNEAAFSNSGANPQYKVSDGNGWRRHVAFDSTEDTAMLQVSDVYFLSD